MILDTSASLHKRIFTVYLGLIAAGYHLARPTNDTICRLIHEVRTTRWPDDIIGYFLQARTDDCAVNPYWPRAFLLTLAAAYLDDGAMPQFADAQCFLSAVKALDLVESVDRNEETLRWLLEFPRVYAGLWAQPECGVWWAAYYTAVEPREYSALVQSAEFLLQQRFGVPPWQLPRIAIIANPLQAPELTDAVWLADAVYVIKAEPDLASCVHEALHALFSPPLARCRLIIERHLDLLTPVSHEMLQMGYAWDHSADSWTRVFEEHLVRAAEIWLTSADDAARDLAAFQQAQQGFTYVPRLLLCFHTAWPGIEHFEQFILTCLTACRQMVSG